MGFALGCAIWAYPGWVGHFFPAGSSSAQLLRLYSQRLTTVECNATFYAIPKAASIERWVAETDPGFTFCPKLPRHFTHSGILQPHLPEVLDFLALMQAFGNRLGVVFMQLPPSYGPQSWSDLQAFLAALQPSPIPLALEVRHPLWFQSPHADRLNTLLQRYQIGRVLLDSRPIYNAPLDPAVMAQRKKPKLPLQPVLTAPFTLVRYISHPTLALNQPFFADWIPRIDQWLHQGTQIYFCVHCPLEAHSPRNAREFQRLLEAQAIAVPPLPWDQIAAPPTQLRLF